MMHFIFIQIKDIVIPFIHFHVVAVPLSNSLTRCHNMVVIEQEAKRKIPSTSDS